MSQKDFVTLINKIFTDNIYNLFLLYGFDLPILQNKMFCFDGIYTHLDGTHSRISILEIEYNIKFFKMVRVSYKESNKVLCVGVQRLPEVEHNVFYNTISNPISETEINLIRDICFPKLYRALCD